MYLIKVQKIKTTFLIFFLLVASTFSLSIVATENSNGENIFLDSDQDDLSDAKELVYKTDPKNPDSDGDGYSDGAEVKSGYDPLKPAPGDKLSDQQRTNTAAIIASGESSGNLTDDLSGKIATMISSGDSADGIDMSSINNLIEESMANNITFSDLPEIDESTIKILEQNYSEFSEEKQARKKKEDDEAYLSAVFYIITNEMPHSMESKEAVEDFTDEIIQKIPSVIAEGDSSGLSYFTDLADKGTIMLDKLNEIEVPRNMLETHKKGLQLANYAISLKDKVKIDNNDPIASLVSFSEVENMLLLSNEYITEAEQKLEELGLTNFVMEQGTNL